MGRARGRRPLPADLFAGEFHLGDAGRLQYARRHALVRHRPQRGRSLSIEEPLFTPVVTHYTKETAVSGDDTGHRNYKIYPLEMYTEELAAQHGVQIWDQTHTPTLVGGAFTVENLKRTVKTYIPAEFLPDWLQ